MKRPASPLPIKKRPQYKRPRSDYVAIQQVLAKSGEMKYYDTALSANLTASTDWTGTEQDPGTVLTLCAPIVGAAINQRIGREIKVYKVRIKGVLLTSPASNLTATTVPPTIFRVLLVQDKQSNASQMQGEQVMNSTGSALGNISAYQSLLNIGRFNVLKDETFHLDDPNVGYGATSFNSQSTSFKWTHKYNVPVSVRFNATGGGTIADIVDNSWHVLAMVNSIYLTPQISYNARVYYKEQ